MSFILEQNFYDHSIGFPLEKIDIAGFSFGCNLKGHDSYGIITNSYPMYVRVFPLRDEGQYRYVISEECEYANLDSQTRDKDCPKIAWGISAYLFRCFSVISSGELYNRKYCNHIIKEDEDIDYYIDENEAKTQYLYLLWDNYKRNHSGIKYRKLSERNKRLTFLRKHLKDEKAFWKRTDILLKSYLLSSANVEAGELLYNSIKDITKHYCKEIKKKQYNIQYRWIYQLFVFIKKNLMNIFSFVLKIFKTFL